MPLVEVTPALVVWLARPTGALCKRSVGSNLAGGRSPRVWVAGPVAQPARHHVRVYDLVRVRVAGPVAQPAKALSAALFA